MHLKVIHSTKYRYKTPVKLDIQYLRFYPLDRPYLRLCDFRLDVTPEPAVISPRIDTENNCCHQLRMKKDQISEFIINAEIELQVNPFNPFDFLLDPEMTLDNDLVYPEDQLCLLKPYLHHPEYPEIKHFVTEVQKESDDQVVRFLLNLVIYICQFWSHQRNDGEVDLQAKTCFDDRTGSCKELAWMLIVMLRGKGLASRFVSGYAFNPLFGEGHELHAWVEVLLPGAGWVGLDPSAGLFTNEYYIPVATSYDPANTMPVTGFYRGTSSSKLDTSVNIRVQENE